MADDETPDPYDPKNLMAMSDEIMKTLEAHGIDPTAMPKVDPKMMEQAMEAARAYQQAYMGGGASQADDPVSQLAQLAELHKKGQLSDSEFETAKAKLLDERWSQGG